MKYYRGMIDEILNDERDGILSDVSTVQILRDRYPVKGWYYPIVDFYYDKATMASLTKAPIGETEQEREDREEVLAMYHQDGARLEQIQVGALLLELMEWKDTI